MLHRVFHHQQEGIDAGNWLGLPCLTCMPMRLLIDTLGGLTATGRHDLPKQLLGLPVDQPN